MQIKFLVDFRGRETNERYYTAGQLVELDDQTAARLIADKRAESAEPEPEAQPEPEQTPKKGRRK